jgi:hypothetical protein
MRSSTRVGFSFLINSKKVASPHSVEGGGVLVCMRLASVHALLNQNSIAKVATAQQEVGARGCSAI